MHDTEHRNFDDPDETREFPNGRAEIIKIGGGEVGRLVFEPGWRWSNDVKPIALTDSCLAPHFQYHVSGRLAIKMDDGTEFIAGPGDVTSLPSGHDGWVVGDETAVVVDWFGASSYAQQDATPPTNASDVVDRFETAWVEHDLDTALSMLTDDCVFEATGPAPDGVRCVGPDAIREMWQPIFDDPATRFGVEQTINAGDRVVRLWRYDWSDGHVRGVDVYRVRGERIAEKLCYVKG